ncbi:MAG: hypothetical protein ACAI43_20420 [Phycisphaerae bacterium]|nr:hypothetical protein [Tepidisphaeraceae bacterium]
MKRLARILTALLTAASALACAGTAVLWARSYDANRVLFWVRPDVEWHFGVGLGELWAYRAVPPASVDELGFRLQTYQPPTAPRPWGYGPPNIPFVFDRLGFGFAFDATCRTLPGRRVCCAIVPCWAACALTALPPIIWLVRRLRRRAARLEGRCKNCGYDLRATPDRCPECGTPADPAHAPASPRRYSHE